MDRDEMNEREECRARILSEDYMDIINGLGEYSESLLEMGLDLCLQYVNDKYVVVYFDSQDNRGYSIEEYGYRAIPSLYSLADTTSVNETGAIRLRNQPGLNLRGSRTLIGFVDTGIDYQNQVFRYSNGESRIVGIWDQTIQTGRMPANIDYGSEYTKQMIDEALASDNPLAIVPSADTNGHGTFMAGIAAGGEDTVNDFTGVAPGAYIAMVKLKPAKKKLRDFYLIKEDAEAYQENDIMLGVRYLRELAFRLALPLVICIGVQNNLGGHSGESFLSGYLDMVCTSAANAVVTATGNMSNQRKHYFGELSIGNAERDVEIRVGEGTKGFCMELWGDAPDLYTISITSPTGERVPKIQAGVGRSNIYDFVFERTVIYVDYQLSVGYSGAQLIFMRFEVPTPGIWTVRVYNSLQVRGSFHLWLQNTEFVGEDIYFLNSNPDVTVTDPGNANGPITVGAYNHYNNSIYLYSGRGYTRTGNIKPDIAAPGVEIWGPLPNNRYGRKSGTSIAAAHTAGAVAMLMEWALERQRYMLLQNESIKTFLIRGANQEPDSRIYPNREWGDYGNIVSAFLSEPPLFA